MVSVGVRIKLAMKSWGIPLFGLGLLLILKGVLNLHGALWYGFESLYALVILLMMSRSKADTRPRFWTLLKVLGLIVVSVLLLALMFFLTIAADLNVAYATGIFWIIVGGIVLVVDYQVRGVTE